MISEHYFRQDGNSIPPRKRWFDTKRHVLMDVLILYEQLYTSRQRLVVYKYMYLTKYKTSYKNKIKFVKV